MDWLKIPLLTKERGFLMIKGKWLARIAASGAVILFGPLIVTMIVLSFTQDIPNAMAEFAGFGSNLGICLIILATALWSYSLWRAQASRFSIIFLVLGFFSYLIANLGFGVYASVQVGHQGITDSFKEALYYRAIQPVGTLLLIAPFIYLGWIGDFLAQKRDLFWGLVLFAIGVILLGYMYLLGHMDSQTCMLAHKWTCAALSVGSLPFKSLIVLVPLWFVAMLIPVSSTKK